MGVRDGDAPAGYPGAFRLSPPPRLWEEPGLGCTTPADTLGSGRILPHRSTPLALNVKRGPRCSRVLKYYFYMMEENVDKPNCF